MQPRLPFAFAVAIASAWSLSGTSAAAEYPVPTQDPDDTLPQCYPKPHICQPELHVVKYAKTPNGETKAPRGFNTYGMQANPNTTNRFLAMNQGNVTEQCDVLAGSRFKNAGYEYCSLDAAWNSPETDENGRIVYNSSNFNLPQLADHLHSKGLKLGVYVIPGVPKDGLDKTVLGTNIKIRDIVNANLGDGVGGAGDTHDFDYSKDGVQQWHDSLIELWASWGVDFIKLDFLTPGSPQNGAKLLLDNRPAARAYHEAIKKVGRQMHLGLSWKLCRNETMYPAWSTTADSMRTDQDINNAGASTFTEWEVGQRAIENYRQFIVLGLQQGKDITIHPDMDNWYVGNEESVSGVTDNQRVTFANQWAGAGANLITGSDLKNVDKLGLELLTSEATVDLAEFCSVYPMQPRNPASGCSDAQQLQSWIAGPNELGEAYVMLVNYGPDLGQGGFGGTLTGAHPVSVSLKDLGLKGGSKYRFVDVRGGSRVEVVTEGIARSLDEGESVLFQVSKG